MNTLSQLSVLAVLFPWWVIFVGAVFGGFFFWLSRWPAQDVKIIPTRASKFDPNKVPEKIDTIVIGSGSGGCACANLLAQAGQKVLLLEQHPDRTGGCTHSFRQEGCEWDTGLHYTSIGMSKATQRAGALLKFMTKDLQHWTRLEDPYDQVLFPPDNNVAMGRPNFQIYDFSSGKENVVKSLVERVDPGNEKLEKQCMVWMNLCELINDGFTALGLSRVLPSFLHGIVRRRIDQLYKLGSCTVKDIQFAVFNLNFSVEDILTHCAKAPQGSETNPVLRRIKAVLTHPLGDYAVMPREATFAAHGITMAHYMQGAAYTVGPTQNISIRSSSMVRMMGGDALCDATVEEILLENGRARGVLVRNTSVMDAPVTKILAKNVVCATSCFNLYHKLRPKDHPEVNNLLDPTKASIKQSNGHIFLFCKIQGDASKLNLPRHNLWYFNGYDLDEAFDKYFQEPIHERPPTVYIGFPCTKDPTWPQRLPNVSNCILISDGLWSSFEKWEHTDVHNRGSDYEEFKNQLAKHLLDILYESVPQIRGKVVYWTLGTPLSEVTYLSSYHGGSYGTKCDTNMLSPMNSKWTTNPRTPIPNLFMAGSDGFLPAVCGAMYGGCFAASAVLGHFGTLRLICAFLNEFASSIQEENPRTTRVVAYWHAIRKFITDK